MGMELLFSYNMAINKKQEGVTMKKRIIASLLAGSLAVTLFAGCGSKTEAGDNSTSDGTQSGQTEQTSSGKTISLMASQDWVYDAEMELGKEFEAQTGIKVDYQIVPADQYYNLLMTKLNGGEGPDIFAGQSGKFDIVSQYNVVENAVDLSNEPWVESYNEFAKEQTSVDGVVYGATYFDVSTDYYVIYNKKLFAEHGVEVPTTFAEFEQVCQTLLDAGVTPVYEPVADGWHQTMWFTAIGGKYEELIPDLVEKLNNNEITFAELPEMEEALNQLKSLADNGYFGDNYLSDTYADFPMYLGSGEFAMTICKPGEIASIVEASNGAYTEEDFGMFLIPLLDNDILNEHPCGPTRYIYSGSENIEEAKQYLEFITSADSVQYMIDNAPKVENLPYEVGQTPAYTDATKEFLDSFDKSGVVLQDTIKYLNPQWMDLSQDLVALFIGDMTAKDVLTQIDARRATQAQAAGDEAWS